MYTFSPKLKSLSIILIVVGLVLFGAGYFINHGIGSAQVEHLMEQAHSGGHTNPSNSSEMIGPQDQAAHLAHATQQIHNRPMASFHTVSVFIFGICCAVLFFYSIQHAAHAGWSIIVTRVMEAIAYFIPIAGILVLISVLLNITHSVHLFHWMDPEVTKEGSAHFDVLLFEKSKYLNIPFYTFRALLFVIGASFFAWKLRTLSKQVDETKSRKTYQSLYNWAVGYIVFFGFCSAFWAWDWLMSLDPHWYSTMYIWFAMTSCWSTGIAIVILYSVYLKKKGFLPQFNDNHLHDLAKWLFAISMVWTYTWFAQFMLYWFANIPEEANYFIGRFDYYPQLFLPSLIPTFLIPLIVMISSSIKRNYKVVVAMCIIVIFGQLITHFLMVMPATVGPYWLSLDNVLLFIGMTVFVIGLFIFFTMSKLAKLKLVPTGNPFYHESEIYEYPF